MQNLINQIVEFSTKKNLNKEIKNFDKFIVKFYHENKIILRAQKKIVSPEYIYIHDQLCLLKSFFFIPLIAISVVRTPLSLSLKGLVRQKRFFLKRL